MTRCCHRSRSRRRRPRKRSGGKERARPSSPEASRATLGCDAAELRNDVVAVRLKRLLLPLRHEIDVELVDTDGFELFELLRHLIDVPEHTEAVDDLVGDEFAVLRADARVIFVV